MNSPLTGRSFLTLKDFSPDEIRYLLDLSHEEKRERRQEIRRERFKGKTIALLFEKRSTRTRCSFETAFGEEGGHPVFLSPSDIHLGEKESIEDTARVLGRMFDCIQFRGYRQETAEILARYSGKPVYNGLTDSYHPTQALADLMTIEEVFKNFKKIKVCYIGDGRNNVAVSLMIGCSLMGLGITAISPVALTPPESVLNECRKLAGSNDSVHVTDKIEKGIKGAHVVYTDVWTSMGEEEQKKERIRLLSPYQVNRDVMRMTGMKETIFLHCLPAVKGEEVTADIFEDPCSRVFDQAENRKHTIKAVILATLGI